MEQKNCFLQPQIDIRGGKQKEGTRKLERTGCYYAEIRGGEKTFGVAVVQVRMKRRAKLRVQNTDGEGEVLVQIGGRSVGWERIKDPKKGGRTAKVGRLEQQRKMEDSIQAISNLRIQKELRNMT